MIEVLVTLVLIAIGILGMVAMQARTIAYTQDSVQRNTAALFADELLEILRADSGLVMAAKGLPENSNYFKASGSAFPNAQNCDSAQNESDRLGCWAARMKEALPGANEESFLEEEFHICRTDGTAGCTTTGSLVEIQLAWRVREGECLDALANEDDDPTICHYRVRAEI